MIAAGTGIGETIIAQVCNGGCERRRRLPDDLIEDGIQASNAKHSRHPRDPTGFPIWNAPEQNHPPSALLPPPPVHRPARPSGAAQSRQRLRQLRSAPAQFPDLESLDTTPNTTPNSSSKL